MKNRTARQVPLDNLHGLGQNRYIRRVQGGLIAPHPGNSQQGVVVDKGNQPKPLKIQAPYRRRGLVDQRGRQHPGVRVRNVKEHKRP